MAGFGQIGKLIGKTAAAFKRAGTRKAITQLPVGDMFDEVRFDQAFEQRFDLRGIEPDPARQFQRRHLLRDDFAAEPLPDLKNFVSCRDSLFRRFFRIIRRLHRFSYSANFARAG